MCFHHKTETIIKINKKYVSCIKLITRSLKPSINNKFIFVIFNNRWHGEYRKCSELFTLAKTDDGFCCSFNIISLAEGFAKAEDLGESDDSEAYDYGSYDSYPTNDYGFYYDSEDYSDGSEDTTNNDDSGDGSDNTNNNQDGGEDNIGNSDSAQDVSDDGSDNTNNAQDDTEDKDSSNTRQSNVQETW